MSRRAVHVCLLAILAVAGCHTCHRDGFTTNRPPCDCGDAYRQPLAPVPQPLPRQPPPQPPIARLEGPAQATYQAPQDKVPDSALSDERPPDGRNPPPPGDFPRAEPDVQLLPPRALSPYRRDVAKSPQDADEAPKADVPNPLPKDDKPAKENDTESLLRIRTAIAEVSAGLRPFELEDFKWLRKKGYRALLHLRDPDKDKDDVVAPRICDKQGMVYRDLPVSAKTLTAKAYDEFVQLVNDTNNYPLYVYDRDGTVAGGLWYLYFRLEKNEDDATAKARAKRLGLDFESDQKEHKDVVLAVQTVLAEKKP